MQFVTGTALTLTSDLLTEVARYRHRVFVEKLGWQLLCNSGLEYDQFDRADTVYVIAKNSGGNVSGTARLLPTTRPYLLSEVFSTLLNGGDAPCSESAWELSRFAAVDFDSNSNSNLTSPLMQFSSTAAVELLKVALDCAAKVDAERLVTVSPVGVERLLRKAGFLASRIGCPATQNGHSIVACSICVDSGQRYSPPGRVGACI